MKFNIINKLTIEDISKLFYSVLDSGYISFAYVEDDIITNSPYMLISWILSNNEHYTQKFSINLIDKFMNLEVNEMVEEFIKPTAHKFKAYKKLHDKEKIK